MFIRGVHVKAFETTARDITATQTTRCFCFIKYNSIFMYTSTTFSLVSTKSLLGDLLLLRELTERNVADRGILCVD